MITCCEDAACPRQSLLIRSDYAKETLHAIFTTLAAILLTIAMTIMACSDSSTPLGDNESLAAAA